MCGTWVQISLLLLLGIHAADGFLNFRKANCVFNSTNPDDIEYFDSYFYNKMEIIRFSSSLGKFVGYTDIGVKNAEKWNNDPSIISQCRAQKFSYCVHNIGNWYPHMLTKSAKPYAVLSSSAPSGGSDRVLVCSVYGFYPKHISVSWTNNQKPIKTGVTSTDLMPDSDWYYQVQSQLEYSPRSGDHISCLIEHASLSSPLVLNWDGSMSDGDRNKIAIGASGLVLGLVLSLAGFIYYKRKSQGRILVPNH